jgi:HSP20 family protein
MSIMRWSPSSISSIFDEDFEFPQMPLMRNNSTGLNVYETEKELVAEMALPGVSEDLVDISMDGKMVRVSAKVEEKKEEEGKKRYYMSSMTSQFNYSFRLPEGVNFEEDPEATMKEGVLTLKFKKTNGATPKRIKVNNK